MVLFSRLSTVVRTIRKMMRHTRAAAMGDKNQLITMGTKPLT